MLPARSRALHKSLRRPRPGPCPCTALQKINHFNGMLEICRKKSMARNLSKMAKIFPEHYDFFPKTFLLPNDMQVRAHA